MGKNSREELTTDERSEMVRVLARARADRPMRLDGETVVGLVMTAMVLGAPGLLIALAIAESPTGGALIFWWLATGVAVSFWRLDQMKTAGHAADLEYLATVPDGVLAETFCKEIHPDHSRLWTRAETVRRYGPRWPTFKGPPNL